MIFLSAQPDDFYFLWQLKLQIFNFKSVGIQRNSIHVLICYDPFYGINKEFSEFLSGNDDALFFTYPDTRISRNYVPSLRPHIIGKHFSLHPELENEVVFYHDSDILFKNRPSIDALSMSDTWFVSDTSSYLSSEYIINAVGKSVFHKMCEVVDIDPLLVQQQDHNAGGAQYVIKKCSEDFWRKIESDCEKMFHFLEATNVGLKNMKGEHSLIQSWCTDMWVIWWNCLLEGRSFEIHPSLAFVCVYDNVESWNDVNILHYTGSHSDDPSLFIKGKYTLHDPFFEDFRPIDKRTCSYVFIKWVEKYRQHLEKQRLNLSDVSFLILLRIDSESRLDNLTNIINYLNKNIKSNIYVLEVDSEQMFDQTEFPESINYEFVSDQDNTLYRAKYINRLIEKTDSSIICIYDVDVVLTLKQIQSAVELIREGRCKIVSPYDGSFLNVDKISKAIFSKILDPTFLESNQGKFVSAGKRSFGGAIFLDRKTFQETGLENVNIYGWGPDDLERVKRMEILGYKTQRIKGNLYHLHHSRGENSGYKNEHAQHSQMEEYLKICQMEKGELLSHVESWQTVANNG